MIDKVKYWFFITYSSCPICGKGTEFREKRTSKRPEAWEDRHKLEDNYDYCDAL